MGKPRVLFVHHKCLWYRIPIFNMLAKKYDTCFIFTKEKKVDDLKAEYRIIKRHGFGFLNIAVGLIPALFRYKYDLVVFPQPNSPGELIDCLICFFAVKVRRKPYTIWSGLWKWKEDKDLLPTRLYKALGREIVGYIYRNANSCVSYGTKHSDYLLHLGVPAEKIFIAPQSSVLNTSNCDVKKVKDDLGIAEKKIVLYVGRLIELKGVNYLIEAFARIRQERKDVCLIIIGGDGWYGKTKEKLISVDRLKILSEKLGLKLDQDIFFLGEVENNNLSAYYLISNIFVLPGITHRIGEAWGLVLNEAMQFGKPVISTDAVGAAYDLIEDGINGFRVPERDVEALYKAMCKILSDKELEQKMGKESKRIISNYSYERMFDGFEKAINHALNQKGE